MVIMSNDNPSSDIMNIVPMNDTGNPMAIQNEKRKLKNSHMVRNTRNSPCKPLPNSISRRSRTIEEIFWVSSKRTPGGEICRCLAMKSATASTTLKVSSSSVLVTSSSAARRPLNMILSSASSNLSVMVAISPRRISDPLAPDTTIRLSKVSTDRRSS